MASEATPDPMQTVDVPFPALDPTRAETEDGQTTKACELTLEGGDSSHWPVIPGYTVVAEIARGGMGQVFSGRDLTLNREVAIKTLLPGADPERFVTESKITARLAHPGIAPIHALGSLEDGSHYLVMKLIRGRTFAELLKDRTTPARGLANWLQVFEQIAQAVGFAHSQGIIHRDLKPLNVMIGAFGEVQVMDWGLAKELHNSTEAGQASSSPDDEEFHGHTLAGTILGTPGYMAPEQARGEETGPAGDVFSLGAMLTVILTGQLPITGNTARELIERAMRGDLDAGLARLDACGADADLIAIARDCLAARPEDRPADAQCVAERIARYRAGVEDRLREAETARAAGLVREAEQRKRRKQLLISGALLATVLLAGIVGTSIGLVSARQAANAEKQQRQQAERRLAQVEEGNEIITSIFTELDNREIRQGKEPLDAVLARGLIRAARRLEGDSVGDSHSVALLQNRLALSLLNLGHPQPASELFKKARSTWLAELGAEHPNTLMCTNSLAVCYSNLGQLKEALPLLEETWKVHKKTLGPDHADTLTSMGNLASCYDDAGQPDRALELTEESLRLRRAKLGDDHPHTLASLNNLAVSHFLGRRYEKALPLFEEALKRRKVILGADHPDTLSSSVNLAACYRELNLFQKAITLLEEVVQKQKAKVGADHPDTLAGMNNLAYTHNAAGHTKTAIPIWEETLRRRKKAQGPDHPDTLSAMNLLASGYARTKQLDRAVAQWDELLKLKKGKFGTDHDETRTTLYRLASACCEARQGEKAAQFFTEYFKSLRQKKPLNESLLASQLTSAGWLLLKAKQAVSSESFLRESLAIRGRLEPDAWTTFNTRTLLGGALLGQQKYQEAEPLLQQGYEGLKSREREVGKENKQRVLDAIDRLLELYQVTGNSGRIEALKAERARLEPQEPGKAR